MWVAACLFVGVEDIYQLLHGELTPENAEHFYRSAWPLGTTLQVTDDQWPPTRAEFDEYWTTNCATIQIDDTVRAYLNDLIDLKMINPLLRVGFAPLLRFLTIGFLAPQFRDALGVTWSPQRQRWFERLFLLVAFTNRFLPRQGGTMLILADIRRRIRRAKRLI